MCAPYLARAHLALTDIHLSAFVLCLYFVLVLLFSRGVFSICLVFFVLQYLEFIVSFFFSLSLSLSSSAV